MQAWEEKVYEREEGREEGEELKLIRQVCKKIQKNQNCSEIADALEEEEEYIQSIMDAAKGYAPKYDAEQILEELKGIES